MSTLDGVSVMLMVGALGASAALAFALGCAELEWQAVALPRFARLLRRPGMLALKWHASKLAQKKYGDPLMHSDSEGGGCFCEWKKQVDTETGQNSSG